MIIKCVCGCDQFYDSNMDFALCVRCGKITSKSKGSIVEAYSFCVKPKIIDPIALRLSELSDDELKNGVIGKPVIGLIPKFIVQERRIEEIHEAIMRYKKASKPIPKEWIDEYNDLIK